MRSTPLMLAPRPWGLRAGRASASRRARASATGMRTKRTPAAQDNLGGRRLMMRDTDG